MTSNPSSQLLDGEKVIIIGAPFVGKTSILLRYCENNFSENTKPTVGCERYDKEVAIEGGNTIKLHLWDTAGQERFRGMASSYYKDAECVIIVFDITENSSFTKMDFWTDEVHNYAKKDVLVVVVGNKSDMEAERQVSPEEIEKFVKKNGYFYLETSALDNSNGNIEKVFNHIAEELAERRAKKGPKGEEDEEEEKWSKNFSIDRKKGKEDGCNC